MSELVKYILLALPEMGIALAVFYWQRKQKERDAEAEQYREAKRRQDLLAMEMQFANAKLSFATAMALKRGLPNGEIEEGLEAYEKAREKYLHFLNEQAVEHLNH